MLGLGHSLIAGTYFQSEYENKLALDFDGTNDYALAGISGQNPADSTIKPLTNGLTLAAWVRLDIDANSYDSTGTSVILSTVINGGYSLQYSNKRFSFTCKLVDGDGNLVNTVAQTPYAKMRTPTGASDYTRFLHKSDGWHFVVGTWDGDRIKKIFVDGDHDTQFGTGAQDGTSGVTKFGSLPESSDSKKTENASSGGAWQIKYDATADRDEVDLVVGAGPAFTAGSNTTVGSSNFWQGQVGDFAIWDKELSQAEIKALYNLHVPTDMSKTQAGNLQGYWKAEEGSGTTVAEETGNVGSDMTLVNGVDNTSTAVPSLDVTGYEGYR